MASKNTQITLRVAAVDATARVFKDVQASASSTLKSIARWAATLGGAYLSVKGVYNAVKELGKLSDVAQAAGASVNELTQLSRALDVIGIKGSGVDELAAAFQRMVKTTGETGAEGFYKIIEQISQLPTQQERATEAMRVFGRTGLQFLPLVNRAAEHGIESIKGVAEGMPGISDAAAQAGDSAADALNVAGGEIKKIWYDVVGKVVGWLDSKFAGGLRAAVLKGAAYFEYFVHRTWRTLTAWKDYIAQIWRSMGGTWQHLVQRWGDYMLEYFKAIGGWIRDVFLVSWDDIEKYGIFGKANANFTAAMEKAAEDLWEDVDLTPPQLKFKDLDETLEKSLGKAEEIAKLAGLSNGKNVGGEPVQRAAGEQRRTNPEAILGGSYKAMTYAMRAGYASVGDKIVAGLKRVGDLVEKVAKNTDGLDDIEAAGVVE